MGKTKIFLDTNILISALGWKGKPRVVFEKCLQGELELVTSLKIPGKVKVVEEDPDDDAMLETAVVGNVNYLISGDPHLLKLKEFANVRIVMASEFLGI